MGPLNDTALFLLLGDYAGRRFGFSARAEYCKRP